MAQHSTSRTCKQANTRGANARRIVGLAIAMAFATMLAGCAANEPTNLLQSAAVTTTGAIASPLDSLASATDVVTGRVFEAAVATGVAKESGRLRLDELLALDKKCNQLVSRDEVWQDVQAAKKAAASKEAQNLPPISNPWTPENKEFFKQSCTTQARQDRMREIRTLSL